MGSSCVILGASGYAGGELLRLVATHPGMEVAAASSDRSAGRQVALALPHLAGAAPLELTSLAVAAALEADVCFSCLPSGALGQVLGDIAAEIVIDLSDDFRQDETWTYALTEFARESLDGVDRISNPGCYPTAALLCLVPFARAGVIGDPVIIDAISGVSGAGRRAEDRLLFAGLEGSVAAYGPNPHRHVGEIERGLETYGGMASKVSFTPHLAPIARGLLVTARAPLTTQASDGEVLEILANAYSDEPFVTVIEEWPQTKPVAGSNRAIVSARVDTRSGFLIASAAIDNLGKGAAGQALQNANVALGLEEKCGLEGLGVWP